MVRQDVAVTLPWMRQGTELVLATVAALSDNELRERSGLPSWSRAHLVAHLARNAEALGRLAHWAATGEVTPMYPDLESRSADIERTAANPVEVLRADLTTTATELDRRLAAFDETAWSAEVRSALGRPIPGRELPWMRIREVWLHTVDLAAGVTTANFPPDLVDHFLDDVTGVVGAKPDCPSIQLRATDRTRTWALGSDPSRPEVTGTAADLLAWVSGRPAAGLIGLDPLPELPPWI
ncbi:MAG TPA: maleylpyruvate isomerase family mycothiol-dependent enzyme [Sporichthya sp.]|nr:maleylpyruvate isomerase family mycothiol-dependent enzyme [Sporichthya sp.]